MPDKLDIINECLVLTGNDPVAVAEDGSDEWLVASAAYEAAVRHMLDEHDWKFATRIVALGRTGASDDARFSDVYARPADALHIVWVRVSDAETTWRVIGNSIYVNGPDSVTAKVVIDKDPTRWPGLFVKALSCFVLGGIYRGLNEDPGEADTQEKKAEAYLMRARTRGDQEEPKRGMMKSRARLMRRRRRNETIYDTSPRWPYT